MGNGARSGVPKERVFNPPVKRRVILPSDQEGCPRGVADECPYVVQNAVAGLLPRKYSFTRALHELLPRQDLDQFDPKRPLIRAREPAGVGQLVATCH